MNNNSESFSIKKRGEKTSKKQILTSKEKEYWKCQCSKENNMTDRYCIKCSNDIYGFKKDEGDLITTSNYINEKIKLLEEALQ